MSEREEMNREELDEVGELSREARLLSQARRCLRTAKSQRRSMHNMAKSHQMRMWCDGVQKVLDNLIASLRAILESLND